MVGGVFLLVVLIGNLGRRGTGLVGVLGAFYKTVLQLDFGLLKATGMRDADPGINYLRPSI